LIKKLNKIFNQISTREEKKGKESKKEKKKKREKKHFFEV
jgi:hypothetical protein